MCLWSHYVNVRQELSDLDRSCPTMHHGMKYGIFICTTELCNFVSCLKEQVNP